VSLINISVNLVAYADATKSDNPRVKFADLSWSMMGLPTGIPHQIPIYLAPGETKSIVLLNRTLSFNGSTSFNIELVDGTLDARLVGDFAARTGRPDGNGTTEWAVTRTGNLTRFTYTGTGTSPTFGSIVAGDGVTIEAGFNELNQGDFTIVKVGADYFEVINAIAQPETVVAQVEIYSNGPVQIGDTLDLSSAGFSSPNQGKFKIKRVTDKWVQFANSYAIDQTGVTGVASTDLVIYPELHTWMLLAVDRRVFVRVNGDTGNGTEVEPPLEGDLVNYPGLYIKRGKVYRLELVNPSLAPATGTVFLAQ
jgi:hypothetical protein